MLSPLRNRFGIPGVISVVALVFAMLGGAYAASDNSGGGKATASKAGKRGPKGPKGATGPAGPAGANGTNGTNGKDGTNGSTGPTGPTGTAGATGATGAAGEDGEDGETGFTETLPSEKTETGVWSAGKIANFETYPGKGNPILISLSFPIPLEAGMAKSQVHLILNNGKEFNEAFSEVTSTKCKGTVTAPSAEPGNLCIYAGSSLAVLPETPGFIINGLLGSFRTPSNTDGVGVNGMMLKAIPQSNNIEAYGSWAVTAP